GLRENIRVLQQLMPGTVGGTPVGPGGLPIAPNQLLFTQNLGIPDSNLVDPGLFVDAALPLGCRFTARTGARVDWVHTSSDPRLITGNIDLFGFPRVRGEPTGPRSSFDPNVYSSQQPVEDLSRDFAMGAAFVSADYKIDEHLTALARFGYAERAPTLTELYADAPFISVLQQGLNRLIGDPNLRKERLKQVDIGLTADYENFRGGVNAFYAFIHNYITYDQNLAGQGI